jgi:8-amino-7-oxononanoate synthase
MMVRAVVPPTVPDGTSRVRICLHAGNTEDEITGLVNSIELWVQEQKKDTGTEDRMKKRFGVESKARL